MGKRLDLVGRECYIERMFWDDGAGSPKEALARLAAVIDELQGMQLTAGTDDEVLDALRELEVQKRRLAAVDHRLIAETEQRRLAAPRGCASTGALLRQLLRIDPTEAAARVRAAAEL